MTPVIQRLLLLCGSAIVAEADNDAATSTAHATWALFGATVALTISAAAAGVFAYLAFREQRRANSLEMDPALWVTMANPAPDDARIWEILRLEPEGPDDFTLQLHSSKVHAWRFGRDAATRQPYSRSAELGQIASVGRRAEPKRVGLSERLSRNAHNRGAPPVDRLCHAEFIEIQYGVRSDSYEIEAGPWGAVLTFSR